MVALRGFLVHHRQVIHHLPQVLRTAQGRAAVGIPPGERFLGLLHFGTPAREPAPREREPVESYVDFLA